MYNELFYILLTNLAELLKVNYTEKNHIYYLFSFSFVYIKVCQI